MDTLSKRETHTIIVVWFWTKVMHAARFSSNPAQSESAFSYCDKLLVLAHTQIHGGASTDLLEEMKKQR